MLILREKKENGISTQITMPPRMLKKGMGKRLFIECSSFTRMINKIKLASLYLLFIRIESIFLHFQHRTKSRHMAKIVRMVIKESISTS